MKKENKILEEIEKTKSLICVYTLITIIFTIGLGFLLANTEKIQEKEIDTIPEAKYNKAECSLLCEPTKEIEEIGLKKYYLERCAHECTLQ